MRSTVKQKRGANANRRLQSRAVAAYASACDRCGCVPAPEVAADLATRGALIVDLRLCTSEALTAVCVLLREAPSGIKQVVFRDGLTTLGADRAYRERVGAYRRRAQSGALSMASLRLLMTALAAFMAVRGSHLAVLDLAGVPLGREIASLVTPLSRALRDCRARQLRWLGLNGCHLGDSGLSMLLPWLAGKEKTLPNLEALSLAFNGLADVRLVDALLRTRARLCSERKVANLQLVDLSGNPHLGDGTRSSPGAAAPGSVRRHGGQMIPRLGTVAKSKGRRTALVRAAACALAEGLPLRVLRLRRTCLDEESLHPLLQLMQVEKQRCLCSHGALDSLSGFCLEELDISENGLDPSFSSSVLEGLKLLRTIREGLRGQSIQEGLMPSQQQRDLPAASHQLLRRAHSEPCCSMRTGASDSQELPHSAGLGTLERNAMSDGEEYLWDYKSQPAPMTTQAFLLHRAEDKRKFRNEARELSRRQPVRSSNWPAEPAATSRELGMEMGMEMWAEVPLKIAGALGPAAAQSMVRQAVWDELYACMREAAPSTASVPAGVSPDLACPSLQNSASRQPASVRNDENQPPYQPMNTSFGHCKTKGCSMEDDPEGDPKSAVLHVADGLFPDSGILWHVAPPAETPISSDGEAEAEAQLLRHGRLEELRAAVLGTLDGSADHPHGCSSLEQTASKFSYASGGTLHAGSSHGGSLLDLRLDEMHREALADLQAQIELT